MRALKIAFREIVIGPRARHVGHSFRIEFLSWLQAEFFFGLTHRGFRTVELRDGLIQAQFVIGIFQTHEHLALAHRASHIDPNCDDFAGGLRLHICLHVRGKRARGFKEARQLPHDRSHSGDFKNRGRGVGRGVVAWLPVGAFAAHEARADRRGQANEKYKLDKSLQSHLFDLILFEFFFTCFRARGFRGRAFKAALEGEAFLKEARPIAWSPATPCKRILVNSRAAVSFEMFSSCRSRSQRLLFSEW